MPLDTCIWRDFYEDRFSKSGRHLGKEATDLIMKITKEKDKILYSESLIWELKKDYNENEIKDMLNFLFLVEILERVEIKKEEYSEAKKLSDEKNIPFIDCLNAVQARNHKAIMISQDKHFIIDLTDI
ncbi:MAG: PIN domain-containing protein, partial [Nanoarchaeota archaeon]|nr:PIN domain-containing protein [Nanoarchaeota archaeon]